MEEGPLEGGWTGQMLQDSQRCAGAPSEKDRTSSDSVRALKELVENGSLLGGGAACL